MLESFLRQLAGQIAEGRVGLFAELTGVAFSLVWPAGDRPRLLPCQERTPLTDGHRPRDALAGSKTCRRCFVASFDRCFSPGGDGCQFTCPRGVRNYWLGLEVGGVRVAALVLQVRLSGHRRGQGVRRAWAGPGPTARAGEEALSLPPLNVQDFSRACRLLRFVAHDLSQTLLADAEEDELHRASLQLQHSETERVRLRAELHRHTQEAAVGSNPKPEYMRRRRHSLRGVLAYVRANFTRPIQLRDVAAHMRLSETHVSHLVSKGLGIRFKQYLTDLRMERAEQLLADPRLQVAEVALKVGFTDANRFRAAFRAWAGLSPTAWREALGPVPPRGPAPLPR